MCGTDPSQAAANQHHTQYLNQQQREPLNFCDVGLEYSCLEQSSNGTLMKQESLGQVKSWSGDQLTPRFANGKRKGRRSCWRQEM
jgi:hypothetical protein